MSKKSKKKCKLRFNTWCLFISTLCYLGSFITTTLSGSCLTIIVVGGMSLLLMTITGTGFILASKLDRVRFELGK